MEFFEFCEDGFQLKLFPNAASSNKYCRLTSERLLLLLDGRRVDALEQLLVLLAVLLKGALGAGLDEVLSESLDLRAEKNTVDLNHDRIDNSAFVYLLPEVDLDQVAAV